MPTTYHIYAKDTVLYCNINEKDFKEKWELLQVMVGLLKTEYSTSDLSYIKLGDKWDGSVIQKQIWEEDSY